MTLGNELFLSHRQCRREGAAVNNYSSTIAVLPAEGGKSTVEWRGAFYRGYRIMTRRGIERRSAIKAVTAVYRKASKA